LFINRFHLLNSIIIGTKPLATALLKKTDKGRHHESKMPEQEFLKPPDSKTATIMLPATMKEKLPANTEAKQLLKAQRF
jgi:hypothetical protein